MQQILSKNDGSVIYEKDVTTIKECVESAISEGVSLINADLSKSDLKNCTLFRGNCTLSTLSGALLLGANFEQCNLYGVDFTEADMTGADLTRANLHDVTLTQAQVDSLGVGLSEYQRTQVTVIS
jgi:uncharacterized protein YjbI with pentapeptide repeats